MGGSRVGLITLSDEESALVALTSVHIMLPLTQDSAANVPYSRLSVCKLLEASLSFRLVYLI